jgi:hypothetical protein
VAAHGRRPRPAHERAARIEDWDLRCSPLAQAYRLLEERDIGPWLEERGTGLGALGFRAGQYPGSNEHWVEARNQRTISLVQACLIELKAPVRVAIGELP